MSATIAHRGPDDSGVWSDVDAGVVFAHRRLSVIDLSTDGHQPMLSRCGRYAIVFNGEIYNYKELGDALRAQGASLIGASDTEVLLETIARVGLAEALSLAHGMFALGVWDKKRRTLQLARDRIGEKPLYYFVRGTTFGFASELKALRAWNQFDSTIDVNALALFMRHGYIPAPYTIFCNVRKVVPGTVVTIASDGAVGEEPYWQLSERISRARSAPLVRDMTHAVDMLETVLKDVVREVSVADVPIGAFLSGGIDSSVVVAMMQSVCAGKVKTFTIGYDETAYDEAVYARQVAAHLGTDHHELIVTPADALSLVPRLSTIYDEPFADASQIPTFLVSRLARSSVTVALSGDGGDEAFGGYNRYFVGERLGRMSRLVPRTVRTSVAGAIRSVSPATIDRGAEAMRQMLPRSLRIPLLGDRAWKLASVLDSSDEWAMYKTLVSLWSEPSALVRGSVEPGVLDSARRGAPPQLRPFEQMMYMDAMTYLPDDIMVKVDRASMAVSLETRAPFLHPALIDFAWTLAPQLKVSDGVGKVVLRELLKRHVPRRLIERPKMGFGVPIDQWLRGPLRDWAEALIDPSLLSRQGYFNVGAVRTRWQEHLSGRRNWQYSLWAVLMFQEWLADSERAIQETASI